MGAATHGLKTQRFIATVPIKVAMDAPCTVILVKSALPFELLSADAPQDDKAAGGKARADSDADNGHPSLYGDDLGPLG